MRNRGEHDPPHAHFRLCFELFGRDLPVGAGRREEVMPPLLRRRDGSFGLHDRVAVRDLQAGMWASAHLLAILWTAGARWTSRMIARLELRLPPILLVEVVTRREYIFSPGSTPLAELASDLQCISAASSLRPASSSPGHRPMFCILFTRSFCRTRNELLPPEWPPDGYFVLTWIFRYAVSKSVLISSASSRCRSTGP